MFKSRRFIIGIVISVIFLAWALSNEDYSKVWSAITGAQYWVLIPALVLYFIGVWVRAVRWRILLKPIVPRIGLNKTFEIVAIGYMANDVLPARMGELVRAYVISKREGVRKTATLATILVERIFDGLVMVGFAAAVIIFIDLFDPGIFSVGPEHKVGTLLSTLNLPVTIAAVLFLGVLLAFVFVASSRQRAERSISLVVRLLPGKFRSRGERLAGSFVDGLGSLRSMPSMLAVFGLSIVAWLFEASMYYVLGNWGFNLRLGDAPLPFYVYVLATSAANLSSLVPQAPGYVGVFDWIAKVVLVGAFGVASGPAISFVLVLHAALLLPITLLGFFYLWRESMSWSELTGLEKVRAEASNEAHEMEGFLTDTELLQQGHISSGQAETALEQAGEVPLGGPDAAPPAGLGRATERGRGSTTP